MVNFPAKARFSAQRLVAFRECLASEYERELATVRELAEEAASVPVDVAAAEQRSIEWFEAAEADALVRSWKRVAAASANKDELQQLAFKFLVMLAKVRKLERAAAGHAE